MAYINMFHMIPSPQLALMSYVQLYIETINCLEECGRYLETIKVYENKFADGIGEQSDTNYL